MVQGDFSKYNQAVLSDSQREQIDQAKSTVNEQNQILKDEETKLNKSIRQSAVSGSNYSPEAILAAKRQLRQQKSQVAASQKQIYQTESQINAPLSQIKTPEQLEALGYKKQISGSTTTYFKEDTYKKTKDSKSKTFREEEYIFVDNKPQKIIKRDDYSDGEVRRVDEEQIIQFSSKGTVTSLKEYRKGEKKEVENYDDFGRLTSEIKYDKSGNKEQKQSFKYDTDGSVQIKTKSYDKATQSKNSEPVYDHITATLSGVGSSKETEIIKTTRGGKTTVSTTTRTKDLPKSTIASTEKIMEMTKTKIETPKDITPDSFITTGGNQIRGFGDKLQQFKIDDSPDSFGYSAKKKIETGVHMVGAGIETVGEFINLGDAPIKFVKGTINAAEKRGEDGDYGFADTIMTYGDSFQSTSKDIQKNSPTISKVVDQDLDMIGDKLSQAGQKIKSTNIINDEFQQKGSDLKQSIVEKTESFSQKGVDLTYSGFEQTQQKGALNKVIGIAKQDVGIAMTLLGETGSGIMQPIKTAKITEKALQDVKVTGVADIARDFAEVGAGGVAYSAEIVSDPKTYIAGEFEEAALLAKKPTQRGTEIIQSIATNPKGFLKASFGETIFVTGGYAGIKAVATDIEVGTKIATEGITDIAIDNAQKPKSPKNDFEETFYNNNPNSKVEYVTLDSVDVTPSKPNIKPKGIETSGGFAYKTNVVEFNLPNVPNFQRPEINIGRNTRLTKSEIGMAFDYNSNNKNKNEIDFNNEQKSEFNFDTKYDQKNEIKFDDKYDFKNDQKTDTKTKTDYKTDSKFDTKFDYRYDQKTDTKVDTRTDNKFDWAKLGQGRSKAANGFSFGNLQGDKRYISSLGGALTGKTSKSPTQDITGLKFRAILLSNGRKRN